MALDKKEHLASRSIERGLKLPPDLRTLADQLDHPEAICWCPSARALYAGGEQGELYRVPLDGGRPEIVTRIAGGFLLGLAVDGDGGIYACDIGNHRVHRISREGHVKPYCEAIAYPNYPVFAADGALYVSDSGSWHKDDGVIRRIDPGGGTTLLATGPLKFPNGLALSDGWLYIVESTRPGIVRVPITGGAPELVVALDQVIPDGIAFDLAGNLWISCWQPNRIFLLSAAGQLDVVVDDWSGIYVLSPNNVAFFGDGLAELAFPALAGNFIRAFRPSVAGKPLNYPKVVP